LRLIIIEIEGDELDMYDVELLSKLIKEAQGNRSLNQFAAECGINPGNLSRIINQKNTQSPKPETLKKIADHAYNGITHEMLMKAAGHIERKDQDTPILDAVLTAKDEKDIAKQMEKIRKTLMEDNEGLMFSGEPLSPEAIESILDSLTSGMKNAKLINKKYTPKKYRK